MATIYRGSPSRFAFAQSHYASTAGASATGDQMQMQFRYSAYSGEGSLAPLPSAPLPPRPNGLVSMNGTPMQSAGLNLSAGKQMYGNVKAPMYVQGMNGSPLYVNPLVPKPYPPTEMLFVSPGLPTPVELSIYEMKQPTGLLHVTIGNQTVEFLDGVANMPQKR